MARTSNRCSPAGSPLMTNPPLPSVTPLKPVPSTVTSAPGTASPVSRVVTWLASVMGSRPASSASAPSSSAVRTRSYPQRRSDESYV